MEKIEQFIQEYTRNCSNEWYDDLAQGYEPWLTTDDAREVAKIARQETIKEVCEWIKSHLNNDYLSMDEESARIGFPYSYLETNLFVEDLKKHFEE